MLKPYRVMAERSEGDVERQPRSAGVEDWKRSVRVRRGAGVPCAQFVERLCALYIISCHDDELCRTTRNPLALAASRRPAALKITTLPSLLLDRALPLLLSIKSKQPISQNKSDTARILAALGIGCA